MAEVYSYSRIECFDKCRLQYQYRYIDKVSTEIETIEAYMGKNVHVALKEFYDFIKNTVVKSKDWLLGRYDSLWKKNFHDSIKVVKKEYSADDYYEKGKKCLIDYYDQYKPFDRTKIVRTEEPISFPLKGGEEEYQLFGILDRLDWNDKHSIFEIHDYKTSSTLITQEEADRDFQLPLYQLAVMSRWPEAKKARLAWHFLLFNKEIESSRTKEQLEELKVRVVNKIREIEPCQDFPPTKSALCNWCDFKEMCPLWKHPMKMEKLEINEYKQDPGVVLVRKYAELEEQKEALKRKIFEIEEEQAKIEEAAIELAEREDIRVIDGPDYQLTVTIKDELRPPIRKEDAGKWEKLRIVLIEEGKYHDVSTVNTNMLLTRMKSWPQGLIDKIREFLIIKVTKKVDLKRKNRGVAQSG